LLVCESLARILMSQKLEVITPTNKQTRKGDKYENQNE